LRDLASRAEEPQMTDRSTLVRLLSQRSVRRGRFTLASGRESTHYVDARLTTMSPEGLATIGPLALEAIRSRNWPVDAVGGLTLGADPIAYAIALASVTAPPLVRAFTVRKEAKQHGTGRLIEGPMREGDRVVVLEDVITTGGSALRAAEAVQQAGARVSGILALVDREEDGRGVLEARGFPVICLATLSELLDQAPDTGAATQAS
jgi:orotate phosphoribosyltransferase